MSALFPYANILAGLLVLVVGFGFHFGGQLVSVLDWQRACRWGLQEAAMPADYYPYEHGTAMGDVLLGWSYGLIAIGLFAGADWGYALACVPGTVLLYHSLCAWFWEVDRRRAGHGLWTNDFRATWCGSNAAAGVLALAVGWAGPA
ncbi:MAG: hypothetical protein QNJ16_19750 [Rhodobacter sp.]|nr:hypothetical protein [Rhodobacter sp.]